MPKILNFGSLNTDYVYTVDHFARPGETIASLSRDIFCGGKGLNQSIALARAGADAYQAGAVGPDGAMLIELLKADHVDVSFVRTRDCASGHAIIQRDLTGQNSIVIYGGANHCITEADIDSTLSHFAAGDYIVLQNEINSVGLIIEKAKARGMTVVLNPSPIDGIQNLPLHLVDIFLLNELEAAELSRETDKARLLAAMAARHPNAAIVLTLGENGVQYTAPALAAPLAHGIYEVEVLDTTAAGDTFTGYFIASIARGTSVPEALRLASIASALAVSRPGAAPSIPGLAEVLACNLRSK